MFERYPLLVSVLRGIFGVETDDFDENASHIAMANLEQRPFKEKLIEEVQAALLDRSISWRGFLGPLQLAQRLL